MKRPTKKQIDAAYAVIRAEREAEELVKAEALRPYVGKFFKYRNSSGGDRPKWWLYAAVTELKGTWLAGWTFQQIPDGEIRIEPRDMLHLGPNSGYEEITSREFWVAAAKLAETLNAMLLPSA